MAKYTAVGPFVFKRSKKKPNSVKALKPVSSRSEARRAFVQVGNETRDRRNRLAAKRAAKKEQQRAAARAYFGLNRRGTGARGNPLEDLISGKRRLTTQQERSQTVPLQRQYAETPRGFAVVGGASKREQESPANQLFERATKIDTSKNYANKRGRAVHPYGVTTRDEVGGELRRQHREDQKYKERGRKLAQDRDRLERVTKNDLLNRISGKRPLSAGPAAGVQSATRQLKSITKELDTRAKNERKTEAEGFFQALDNLSRPYYAVNAAAKAAVKGKRPDRVTGAALSGLRLRQKPESWDVLQAAGVKNKALKYGLGIPASFASDPLSYVSVGLAPESGGASLAALGSKATKVESLLSAASKASRLASTTGKARHAKQAEKAAEQIQKLIKSGKVQHGPLTAPQAAKVRDAKRGVSVSVGARVPFTQKFVGVRTSGSATKKLRNSVGHQASKGRRNDAKDFLVEHMAPTGRITSLTREESDDIVEAAAKKNAAVQTGGTTRKQTQQGIDAAIRKQLGIGFVKRTLRPRQTKNAVREESAKLAERYDAGEDIGAIGKHIDERMAALLKAEREAGFDVPEFVAKNPDDAKKYLPRYWKSQIEKRARKAEKRIEKNEPAKHVQAGAKHPQTDFGDTRTVQTALKNLDETPGDPRQFARDISGVVAKREQDSIEAIAAKDLNDAIVKTGRKAEVGESTRNLPTGYSVYKYDRGRLERVAEGAVPEGSVNHYVIKDAVENRARELTGGANKDAVGVGKFFDRATGRWKGSVTVAWPGYYLRNLIGDTQLARQAGTDARSMRQSMKISKAVRKRDAIIRKGKHITEGADPDAALKKLSFTIDGKRYTGKELEDLATEHAAISTGQHGSEVAQLVGAEGFSATNRAARFNIRRENLPRRATFIADLKRGNTPSKAGATARKEHFDYATRTEFQKQARRVIPFFAWWDLNTRKQLRTLVTKPGKTNEIYHVMNGAASAAGFEDYRAYLADLPKGKQRGLPIPVVVGHNKDGSPKIKDLQFGNVLSELRTALSMNPIQATRDLVSGEAPDELDEVLARFNPIIGKPAELAANHSGFFRGPIQPDYAPWTKSPKFLAQEKQIDRKTGKVVPVQSKKRDYAIRSLGPWAGLLLDSMTPGKSGPFGKDSTDKIIGLSGVSPSTHDSNTARLDRLYDQRGELQKRYDGLSRVVGGTRRRKDLRRRINDLTNEISGIEKKSGYKIPLNTQGGRKKSKAASNPLDRLQQVLGGGTDNPVDRLGEVLGGGDTKPRKKPSVPSVQSRVNKISSLDQGQKDIVAQIISIGKKRNVPQKHLVAALETGRVESNFANSAAMTDHDSQGWRQERKSLYKNPTNLRASINRFFDEAAQHDRGQSAGDLAADVQRPAAQYRGRYAQHESEAKAILARVRGAKVTKPKPKNLKGDGQKIAEKTGLKITSTWRSRAHNAEVGGVPNSYHTRGSASHPKAMDLVGSSSAMQKAAREFQKKGYSTLIHNAGSGVHLHVQDDKNVGGLGSAGSSSSSASYSSQSTPSSPSATSSRTGKRNTKRGSDQGMNDSERLLALLEYLSTKDKKYATRKLVEANAIGRLSTV